MNPTDDTGLERVRRDAHRILHAMDNTPIAAMDANFYQHYAQELRLIVEELLGVGRTARGRTARGPDPRS